MYKIGDILKANMREAELQYEGCKGTTVYRTLMRNAEEYRFEVLTVNKSTYVLKRNDGQQNEVPKSEVHSNLVLTDD